MSGSIPLQAVAELTFNLQAHTPTTAVIGFQSQHKLSCNQNDDFAFHSKHTIGFGGIRQCIQIRSIKGKRFQDHNVSEGS